MANGGYVGVEGVARKLTKGYVGVEGVARKLTKGYVGVEGVARKCFPGVDEVTWSKWSCDYTPRSDTWYERVDTIYYPSGVIMYQIGDISSIRLSQSTIRAVTDDYTFTSEDGFTWKSNWKDMPMEDIVGYYLTGSLWSSETKMSQVIDVEKIEDSLYDVTYEIVDLAQGYYTPESYEKISYMGTVSAEKGALPEGGTLVSGSATGDYCILKINGSYYYYEK